MDSEEKIYDVLIIGGGPAGLTAAIYAGRAGLSALVIERENFGGVVSRIKELANFPGIIKGESGAVFAARLEEQAWSFGAEKTYGSVSSAELSGDVKEVSCADKLYKGRTVIIASGKAAQTPTKLRIPGEIEFVGRGASYCAACDGAFFAGLDVFVVGGGDSAIEESLYLANIARQVTVICGESAPDADEKYLGPAKKKDNISFLTDTAVTGVGGGDLLTRIETENSKTGERTVIEAREGENFGLFVSVGTEPETGVFGDSLEMKDGYIVTDGDMRTNIPGVFAAGDVRAKTFRQAVLAAAEGAAAALFAGKYLMEAK